MRIKFLSIILLVSLLVNPVAHAIGPLAALAWALLAVQTIDMADTLDGRTQGVRLGHTPETLDMYTEQYHIRVWTGYIYDIPKISKARENLNKAAEIVTSLCREKFPNETEACYIDPKLVYFSRTHYSTLNFLGGKWWEGPWVYEITADTLMDDEPVYEMVRELAEVQFLMFNGKYPYQKLKSADSLKAIFTEDQLRRYDFNKVRDQADMAIIYSRRLRQIAKSRAHPGKIIPEIEARIGSPNPIARSIGGPDCRFGAFLVHDRFECYYKPKLKKWMSAQLPLRLTKSQVDLMSYGIRDQALFRHSKILDPVSVITPCEPRLLGKDVKTNDKSTMEQLFLGLPKCMYIPVPALLDANISVLDQANKEESQYSWQRHQYIGWGVAMLAAGVIGKIAWVQRARVLGSGRKAYDSAAIAITKMPENQFNALASTPGALEKFFKIKPGWLPSPYRASGNVFLNRSLEASASRTPWQGKRIALVGGALLGVSATAMGVSIQTYSSVENEYKMFIESRHQFDDNYDKYSDLYNDLMDAAAEVNSDAVNIDRFERMMDEWTRKVGSEKIHLMIPAVRGSGQNKPTVLQFGPGAR